MPFRKSTPDGANSSSFHILHGPHEIDDLVQVAWARCPNLLGRDLKCFWEADRLVLRGAVRTYYQKQLAQEALRSIPGLTTIQNEIEVL